MSRVGLACLGSVRAPPGALFSGVLSVVGLFDLGTPAYRVRCYRRSHADQPSTSDPVTLPRQSDIGSGAGLVVVNCLWFEQELSESAPSRAAVRPPVIRFTHLAMLPAAVVLPTLLALFTLLLRLHGLADKPLWHDEILSLTRARLPLVNLVIDALTHKHYPTYFLLLRPFAFAHINAWALRFPSAVFGAGCVFLVTRVTSEISGMLAGMVAGLLMALSPLEVQFGQEARPYTLISCLVLVAIWGLVGIAREPQAGALPLNRPDALRGAWAAYLVGTIAALLVENNTVPWLIVSNVAFAVIAHRAASDRGGLLRNWTWVQAIIALVWLPALVIMLSANRGAVLTGLEWVPRATGENIRSIISAIYMFRISDMMTFGLFPTPLPQFGVAVAMLALLGAWRLRAQPSLLAVLGLGFAAMPVAISLISIFQPVLVPRYLLWSTGPFFAMAGIGSTALPMRFASAIAATVAAGGAICLWPYYSSETKPRWDQAAAYLASNVRPQDVIVTEYPSVETMIRSYAEPFHFESKFDVLAWRAQRRPLQVADGERRWILYGRVGQGAQESEEEFRRKWAVLGDPAAQVRFGTHLLILRFDKSTMPPQQSVKSARLEPNDGTMPHTPPTP